MFEMESKSVILGSFKGGTVRRKDREVGGAVSLALSLLPVPYITVVLLLGRRCSADSEVMAFTVHKAPNGLCTGASIFLLHTALLFHSAA